MMTQRVGGTLIMVTLLLSAAPCLAASGMTGEWSVHRTGSTSSRVEVNLRSDEPAGRRGTWDGSFGVDLARLGLSATDLDSGGHHVQFTLERAAGWFACDGWAGNGKGAGVFTFVPSATFLDGLRARGLGEPSPRKVLVAATVDLTLDYIDEISAAGFPHLPLDRLIGFRALDITPASLADLRRTFGTELSEQDALSLAALHVTPAYVADMRSLGVSVPSPRKATALKALGVDRGYVETLAKAGYSKLDAEQLVQLKALGVDDAYIRHLASHGLSNLTVSKLVQLKALGI
jgi:hypothetical protein